MARRNRNKQRSNAALSIAKLAPGSQTITGLDRFGDTHTLTKQADGTWAGALNDASDEDGNPRPMMFTVPDVVAQEWSRRWRERNGADQTGMGAV